VTDVTKPELPSCDAGLFTVERAADFAVAHTNRRLEECVTCSGTGLLRTGLDDRGRKYEVTRPCALSLLKSRLALFNSAQLPSVHALSSFDTFQVSSPAVDKAKTLAKTFAYRWPQERGFVLSGPVGTGKTHLLVATLRHATIELGVRAGYVEISLLYATIRRGFREGKSGGEIIGPLSQLDLLAIDELGKGRGSPFELETLDELISRRYNAGRVTLFATNYTLDPPPDRHEGRVSTEQLMQGSADSKRLVDRVTDRIYSRLHEMCDFSELSGAPDRRREQAELRSAGHAPKQPRRK
jgi:DNA replication protein DnaC